MAQMPIQMATGRAAPFVAGSAPPALHATPRTGSYPVGAGGISGGDLRPGAMDQVRFKTLLAAAQKSKQTAADPALMPPGPARSDAAIPTLSPAQLAALGAIPGAIPGAIEGPQSSSPAAPAPGAAPGLAPEAAPAPAEPAASAIGSPGPMPRARMGADGVWELPRMPDKDEREMLRGQKWRIVEDPEATRLFLGADGRFGWDDFVDLINPLQHIPLVNIAYRAITGDEINGAARMIDFAFGPLAGVSTAVDLAFQDVAGDGIAGTAVAALFGGGDSDAAVAEYHTAGAIQIADLGRQGSNR